MKTKSQDKVIKTQSDAVSRAPSVKLEGSPSSLTMDKIVSEVRRSARRVQELMLRTSQILKEVVGNDLNKLFRYSQPETTLRLLTMATYIEDAVNILLMHGGAPSADVYANPATADSVQLLSTKHQDILAQMQVLLPGTRIPFGYRKSTKRVIYEGIGPNLMPLRVIANKWRRQLGPLIMQLAELDAPEDAFTEEEVTIHFLLDQVGFDVLKGEGHMTKWFVGDYNWLIPGKKMDKPPQKRQAKSAKKRTSQSRYENPPKKKKNTSSPSRHTQEDVVEVVKEVRRNYPAIKQVMDKVTSPPQQEESSLQELKTIRVILNDTFLLVKDFVTMYNMTHQAKPPPVNYGGDVPGSEMLDVADEVEPASWEQ